MQRSAIVTKKILSEQDSALFRQTIGKVKEINTDSLLLSAKKKPKPYPKKQPVNAEPAFKEPSNSKVDKLYQEDSLSFLAPGLQKNILQKMRKGYFGFDASIDLHGLTSEQAKHQLAQFLRLSEEEGCRCVHIIHGKGYRSADNHPVLKNDINVWLRHYKSVQAFCSTPAKHGGTGAVFVLLKLSSKYAEENDTQY